MADSRLTRCVQVPIQGRGVRRARRPHPCKQKLLFPVAVLKLCVGGYIVCTFVAVFRVCSVEVIDGVDRMQLNLSEISVADPVELRSGLRGRRPGHLYLLE